jgi:apolipoprotein N-acyltransferase
MMKGSGWTNIVAAVMSGLLVAGLFPPFDFSWLVWVAMMPLLGALTAVEGKRAGWKGFGIGFLAGAVSCLIQFNWLSTVSSLGAVLLPLYLALYWGIFGAFVAIWCGPEKGEGPGAVLRSAFCQAAVWAGLEWLRGWLFTGFAWNGLGVAFHDTRVMAQGADMLGVTGLSLFIVFFQAVLVRGTQGLLRGGSQRRWDLAVALLLVVALFGYGKIRIGLAERAESIRLKTLLVQINIPQQAARVLWTDLETHQAYEEETLKGLETLKSPDGALSEKWPDWVMWPEVALTGRILRTDAGEWGTWQINHDTIGQVRAAGPFSLIYGVNELEAEMSGDQLVQKEKGRAWNSIAVMDPEDVLQTYRKHHLVIFGETIPFVDSIPFLKSIYEQQSGMEYGGSFAAGESLDPLPIRAGGTEIGAIPTVCFEDSVARLTRKFVRPGPQVIINVTNDGWFNRSPAAAQHFANSRFRAIELRRPLLRCANTGVSAAVDATGSTLHPDTGKSQILTDAGGSHFTRGSLLAELDVPLRPGFSLFAVIGDWGILTLAALGLSWARFGTTRAV